MPQPENSATRFLLIWGFVLNLLLLTGVCLHLGSAMLHNAPGWEIATCWLIVIVLCVIALLFAALISDNYEDRQKKI